jgi:hypothetical protein
VGEEGVTEVKKLAAFLLFAALTVGTASALDNIHDTLRVEVPFAFTIGDRQFPAGHYLLERLNGSNLNVVTIRNTDNDSVSMIMPLNLESSDGDGAKLVFVTDGSSYNLKKIVSDSNTYQFTVNRKSADAGASETTVAASN